MFLKFLGKIINSSKHKVIVLMYHRIAIQETDPWQLAVHPENFEQQLEVLQKDYRVISIRELREQLINKKIEADSVCITFDDAYTDNYLFAKPLLEKFDCPAAFFVPAYYIGQEKPYWWDELENTLLHAPELPASISIFIGQELVEFQLKDRVLTREIQEKHASWVWPEKPPTPRCELYLKLWERLQPLTIREIEPFMNEFREWAGYTPSAGKDDYPMSNRQLEEISGHPLFDIGNHTFTHQALAFHSREMQQYEIAACRKDLEERSGRKINDLAYPYGNYNDTTLSVIKEENIALAFTTQEETITAKSDFSRLGRFQALNQNGKEFEKQLSKWFQYN